MRIEPVTTCLRVLFASHCTVEVVARSQLSLFCLDTYSASVQCTLSYTVSLYFSHKSIVVSFILICTSLFDIQESKILRNECTCNMPCLQKSTLQRLDYIVTVNITRNATLT